MRITAFQLPAGVLTMVAINVPSESCECTFIVPYGNTKKMTQRYISLCH